MKTVELKKKAFNFIWMKDGKSSISSGDIDHANIFCLVLWHDNKINMNPNFTSNCNAHDLWPIKVKSVDQNKYTAIFYMFNRLVWFISKNGEFDIISNS